MSIIPEASGDPADQLTSDFSTFEIDQQLRYQLEAIGSFGCDGIFYGDVQITEASGYLDGYRWLFAVMNRQWFFLVFRLGDAEYVQWENSKELSYEESWDMHEDLDPGCAEYLQHSEVFRFILKGIDQFGANRPFDN